MATLPEAEFIWFNGKLVPWQDAKIHVLSHVVHYGSSFFEGMRCYETKRGPAVFRLDEHVDRLFDSCKIYRVEIPYSRDEIRDAVLETIRSTSWVSVTSAPWCTAGTGCSLALWAARGSRHRDMDWGAYLGADVLENGVDVCISSWSRPAPNTHPALSKAGGNYLNSQLIRMEAIENGYSEGIALNTNGLISEGSGENIFVVKDDRVITNSLAASVLGGITRNSVMTLAQDAGFEIVEQDIPREMLYIADEVFFVGSAVEVTPVRSIDRISVGDGSRGPVTKEIQDRFFAVTTGDGEDTHGWLAYV